MAQWGRSGVSTTNCPLAPRIAVAPHHSPALSRRQTRPTQKSTRRTTSGRARGFGRGRRLMHLLGAGAMVSGGKRRSATLRNDPIRGSAAARRPRGGDAGGQRGWPVKGLSSAIAGPVVPGGKRKSARPRNDPICGSAAERRPEGRMVRTDGADCRSRGCPRPSPSRRCRAGSANRRERATTLYAVLPPSADPRDGRAAWTVGQGAALDLHRAGGAGRQAQIGQTSQRPYMRSCRRAPTRWWAARAGRVDARATGVDGRLEGRP